MPTRDISRANSPKKALTSLRCARKTPRAKAQKKFRIVCGDRIALTPPMGWNSWNCFANAVSADKVKRAADAMVKSGLINHGWTYINIDDFWQNHRNSNDPTLRGEFRDEQGNIVPNKRFPDMKGTGRLHSQPRTQSGTLFFAGAVDVWRLRGQLWIREKGRRNLRQMGFRLPEIRLVQLRRSHRR